MSHPFLLIPTAQRSTLFWISIVSTLTVMMIMGVVGKPLVTQQAPSGIVSFELAGTPSQAKAILDSWDVRAKQYAAFGLGFDYLYMLAYSSTLGLGCLLAVGAIRAKEWPLYMMGVPLAWGMFLAALFDAVENLGLALILLTSETATSWPAIACLCALLKFGLLFLGLMYVLYGLSASLMKRWMS